MIFKTGYFTASLLGANVLTLIDPKALISRHPLLGTHVFDFYKHGILDLMAPSTGYMGYFDWGHKFLIVIDPKHLISRPLYWGVHVFALDRPESLDFTAPSAGA